MKKLLIFLCLILCLCILSGCQTVTTDEFGNERVVQYGLVEIGKVSGDGEFSICYDPTTKICYMKIYGLYRLGISPYYIIGEDGKPEIAVYGVNYK